jgi:hypothetical protein
MLAKKLKDVMRQYDGFAGDQFALCPNQVIEQALTSIISLSILLIA